MYFLWLQNHCRFTVIRSKILPWIQKRERHRIQGITLQRIIKSQRKTEREGEKINYRRARNNKMMRARPQPTVINERNQILQIETQRS